MLNQSNPSGQPPGLHPTTFPSGEQEHVGVAHCRISAGPDVFTCRLDTNREVTPSLGEDGGKSGVANADIFHDEDARNRVCDDQIAILAVLASDPLE